MAKYKIRRITNVDECYDAKTGVAVPFLTFQTRNAGDKPAGTIGDATLEEIVYFLDRDAEDCNAHDFIGVHRLLCAVLVNRIGKAHAKTIIVDIAQHGGLHSMNGVCGRRDSYKELGVGPARRYWVGKF